MISPDLALWLGCYGPLTRKHQGGGATALRCRGPARLRRPPGEGGEFRLEGPSVFLQNGPKMVQKCAKNCPTVQKCEIVQNGPRMVKMVLDWSQNNPKMVQRELLGSLE